MALFKLPFILAALFGQLKTVMNPNPHVSAPSSYSRWDIILGPRAGPFVINSIHTLVALSEALVIITNRYPTLPYAHSILSMLVVRGNPDMIHLTPLFIFASLLAAASGILRLQCYRALGKMFTFKSSIQKDHQLVTSGPYAVVRHPGYTGFSMMYVGSMLWHFGAGSWIRECGVLSSTMGRVFVFGQALYITIVAVSLLGRMSAEDEAMKRQFGKEWEAWAGRVPYKLVPGVY